MRAGAVAGFGRWQRHDGAAFLLVLSGAVRLCGACHARLDPGAGACHDTRRALCRVSLSAREAAILWVTAA